MEVYLDNAATTKPFDSVIEKMCKVLKEDYGNPSSLHSKGISAEKYVSEAKEILSKLLKVEKKEIYFTSGGTESNNLALLGIADAYKRSGKHIITSDIEHPSVNNTLLSLEEKGYEVTRIPVNNEGIVNLEMLRDSIREDTILVSIMHVNNEIGSIQPIEEIGKIIKEKNNSALFHVDAIQSFGKIAIYPQKANIHLLSISGHKFHGPKGIGALYINNKIKIKPIVFGGSQQNGLRSGTENVPGINGLSCAAKIMYENLKKHEEYMYELKNHFVSNILDSIDDVYVNGPELSEAAPNIVNLRFDNIKGEVLLHALEGKGIYISTGSACSSNKTSISTTLQAIGLTNEQIDNSIRFSFSINNTLDELDYCIRELEEIIPKLRKFVRR